MSLNFTAIDFETANSNRASACAVGVAVVENGVIAKTDSRLIKPKEMKFDQINIGIHGIKPFMVENEPEFQIVWEDWLLPAIPSGTILAHNASFDTSVLRQTCCEYRMAGPDLDYFCTLRMAKSHWPDLPSHGLASIADHLEIPFLNHHEAGADAEVAAQICLIICEQLGVDSLEDAVTKLGINPGRMWNGGWQSCGKSKCKHNYDPGIIVSQPVRQQEQEPAPAEFSLEINVDTELLAEMRGIAQGVLADGRVVKSEAEYLLSWLEGWPKEDKFGRIISSTMQKMLVDILEDDVLDSDEEVALKKALNNIVDF